MEKVLEIIRRKPPVLFAIPLVYLILVGVLKWGIHLNPGILSYAVGGIVGIFFLDAAEVFFNLKPSPFRTVIFAAGLAIISFFVVTSTGSLLGIGLVLSLYVTLLLGQIAELQARGNLSSWFWMISFPVSERKQKLLFGVFLLTFILETYIFSMTR